VEGSLNVRGDLASLASTMALEESRIGGLADIDFVVGGTAAEPRIAGQARIVGGVYENRIAGTLFRDLVIDAAADGLDSVKVGFRGIDGAKGAVRGQGRVTLRHDGEIGIKGTLDLSKAVVVRRDDITVTANGRITYVGTLGTGVISGYLEASQVDIQLSDPLPSTVAVLDVVEEGPRVIDGTAALDAALDDGDDGRSAGTPWVGELDLIVKMPRSVFVRGRGLDSEWWGMVRVTGTMTSPRLLGQLQAIDGTFLFAEREFTIDEGTMEFTGIEGINPLVAWSARSEMPDLTAILEVAGWSSGPTVTLTSEPELPPDEILARIMFEKTVSRLTSGEALRLAEGLKRLARGESPTLGIAAFTDRMLGVDVLAMERLRRLAGDVRTRRGQDRWDQEQFGTKTREIEITPNISVAEESNDEDDNIERSKLGVIWKWDY
jgi:translocation and assembly module TamB